MLDRRNDNDDPLWMGVLNITPDSFSDGGEYFDRDAALRRVDELVAEGAQLIDIGGESTRPRSAPVPAEEQIRRTTDAIVHAVSRGVIVSIDTTDAQVAEQALRLGASVVNDVSCLRDGDALARVAARQGAALIIMHAREPMSKMQGFSVCDDDAYQDVIQDVRNEWQQAAKRAMQAGLDAQDVFFDPGLGFNKNARHSIELVARLHEFRSLGHGIVVGPSRKSFLAARVQSTPNRRIGGTIAACLACAARGASVLRIHDVLDVRQAFAVARDIGQDGVRDWRGSP
ncbi:MAG TPA: dihydropteroate synthase [Polyangiaceae bacterium]|jgi:dihydropteroate synthase|nr:MAG: Dihydropteroate synthase [Deltaproteobacteria bacterium ADurb.Bin207]HNS99196.1 dihydropteroate synthase [Polyangiaceae bacterium]HNZ20955.1 dihydropteroate synthase [Polyangiaceae bacterium]HOD24016.1 dihydropteroate synthase [Polyangiaceae bacterium]HOE48883.1 dihydropteroate synthase [Polyangiaceae bacterium]